MAQSVLSVRERGDSFVDTAAFTKTTTTTPNTTASYPRERGPTFIRTTSSHGQELPLRQPIPIPDARSLSLVYANPTTNIANIANIAQLEATAERLSRTSSIDDAIREAHQELKRSDSRRSSLLAAAAAAANPGLGRDSGFPGRDSEPGSPLSLTRSWSRSRPTFSRRGSAARSGGYSPNDYTMSPISISGSGGGDGGANEGDLSRSERAEGADPLDYPPPFLSRHGAGHSSVHSTRSGRLLLPGIAESEPPFTLTQEALNEADRLTVDGAHGTEDHRSEQTKGQDHDHGGHVIQPEQTEEDNHNVHSSHGGQNTNDARPTTSASTTTVEQARSAFRDFDGIHCDPDTVDAFPATSGSPSPPPQPSAQPPDLPPGYNRRASAMPAPRAERGPASHPSVYRDPETGQQMIYYPARVPAMLQLPPKLSKKSKAWTQVKRQSRLLGIMGKGGDRESSAQPQAHEAYLSESLEGAFGSAFPGEAEAEQNVQQQQNQQDLNAPADLEGKPLPTENSQPVAVEGPGPAHEQPVAASTDANPESATSADAGTPVDSGVGASASAGKRKSRMVALDKLPPQLRASVFFDLTASNQQLQIKNGSATATLDSILDAAATAPVNAFTDHAFAGKLRTEVYGAPGGKRLSKLNPAAAAEATATAGKKKRRKSSAAGSQLGDRNSTTLAASASRSSFLSLFGHSKKSADGRATVIAVPAEDSGESSEDDEASHLTPGDDERLSNESSGEEEDEEDDNDNDDDDDEADVFQGPPTTLLAELQMRKQQQKLRTRPIIQAFPNGMHSTLLELDTVAEMERKARKGKRVNLAWEDPAQQIDPAEDDDEDVPLALLYAAKAGGHKDLPAAIGEIGRPLGLLEKKALEDNEPLSRRRDRLQGRPVAQQRRSMLSLAPGTAFGGGDGGGGGGGRADYENNASDDNAAAATVDEVEDEPLADRLRRIKAKEESELPRARPVSTAFSIELLSHFGDLGVEEDKDGKEEDKKGKAKEARYHMRTESSQTHQPEEEETLGQRRRRLQAEKEAREREMAGPGNAEAPGATAAAAAAAADASNRRLSKRLSMADLLAAHPLESARGTQDPRLLQQQQQQQKLAARRSSQMLRKSSSNKNFQTGGGLMGGYQFPRNSMMQPAAAAAAGPWAGRSNTMSHTAYQQQQGGFGGYGLGNNMSVGGGIYGGGMVAGHPYNAFGSQFAAAPMSMQMPMQMNMPIMGMPMPMGMPMGMPMAVPPQGQIDRVERWRQNVYP